MKFFQNIHDNLSQIFAITEKNLKLSARFKVSLIFSFITPIFFILMPFFVMGTVFKLGALSEIGNWTTQNYLVFLLIAYNINLIKNIIYEFPSQFQMEKYWETLSSIIIAPFNRINLLFGILLSQFLLVSIPFTTFFIIGLILFPINWITIVFVLLLFFLILLLFSGIGLLIAVFAISKENIWKILVFSFDLLFWFSAIIYPIQIFPQFIQNYINLNPLFFIFDFLRLSWVENNIIFSLTTRPLNFSILLIFSISVPVIGVLIFNKVIKKYGIVGY